MTDLSTFASQLDAAMSADRHRLLRQLQSLGKNPDRGRLEQWQSRLAASCARAASRAASVPPLRYDDSLPIGAEREELRQAIAEHQVVVIAGAAGCGKSSRWPKICLELGRGRQGPIGH